jgi:chromosome segregation ATPase
MEKPMLRKLLSESYEVDQARLAEHIYRSLEDIRQKLETEISNKQKIIDSYTSEIKYLRAQLAGKEAMVQNLELKISESQLAVEGNRQLVNKLLNDLDRMQQDIEWYKRTYENRSLLGVIKDKLKHVIS